MSDSSAKGTVPPRPPNCLKCKYYKVTWEPAFPRACVIFGIKCSDMPNMEVFKVTGASCPSFKLKEGLK